MASFLLVFLWFSAVLEPKENQGKTKGKPDKNDGETKGNPGKPGKGKTTSPPATPGARGQRGANSMAGQSDIVSDKIPTQYRHNTDTITT